MGQNGSTAPEEKTAPFASCHEAFSFGSLLDETCERLLDRQVKYSIQRIHELEKRLLVLENELNAFLQNGSP